jgi:outer membrane protein
MCLPVAAEPPQGNGPPGQADARARFSAGLAVISAPRPYAGASNDLRPVPMVELEVRRFYVRGIFVGYQVIDGGRIGLDLQVRPRFTGYEPDESPVLAGMAERRESIDAGLAVDWRLGSFELETSVAADVLGRSDGVEAGVDLSRRWFVAGRKAMLVPSLGVVWQSRNLVDYYFGVRPEEALPERPAYAASSAISPRAGFFATYRLSPRLSAVLVARVQRLADEIEASPIVDRRWGHFELAGISYTF